MVSSSEKLLQVASVIIDGDISSVDRTCPHCNKQTLVFSFTVIDPPRYGLFVVCSECQKGQHFSLIEKPANFREDLVLKEFQKLEDEAHQFATDTIKNDKQ